MGRLYHTDDNAEIFSSKRYRYFFDLPLTPRVCDPWYGEDHPDSHCLHPDVVAFCETITGQKVWNNYGPYPRWGWLGIHISGEKVYVMPYITSHLRMAFVRKRDAALFKLAWV